MCPHPFFSVNVVTSLWIFTLPVLRSTPGIERPEMWALGVGGVGVGLVYGGRRQRWSVFSTGGVVLPQQVLNCAWSCVAGRLISYVTQLHRHVSHRVGRGQDCAWGSGGQRSTRVEKRKVQVLSKAGFAVEGGHEMRMCEGNTYTRRGGCIEEAGQ